MNFAVGLVGGVLAHVAGLGLPRVACLVRVFGGGVGFVWLLNLCF